MSLTQGWHGWRLQLAWYQGFISHLLHFRVKSQVARFLQSLLVQRDMLPGLTGAPKATCWSFFHTHHWSLPLHLLLQATKNSALWVLWDLLALHARPGNASSSRKNGLLRKHTVPGTLTWNPRAPADTQQHKVQPVCTKFCLLHTTDKTYTLQEKETY